MVGPEDLALVESSFDKNRIKTLSEWAYSTKLRLIKKRGQLKKMGVIPNFYS